MKEYKEVKVEAKNAPAGSYAAGCPMHSHPQYQACMKCELAK